MKYCCICGKLGSLSTLCVSLSTHSLTRKCHSKQASSVSGLNYILHDLCFQQLLYVIYSFPTFRPKSEIKEMIDLELSLTAEGIAKKNAKSYPLWHHRKWIVEKGMSNVYNELDLCSTFLDADERNFHCWDYRRSMINIISSSSSSSSIHDASDTISERNIFEKDITVTIMDETVKKENAKKELEYTLEKIHQNFSNYSGK